MDQKGINPSEITLAETLQSQGYATACIGKWHLGDQAGFLPTRHGFDFYYGIPYSNDSGRKPKTPPGDRTPPLPLMRNETVIEAPAKQETLTQRYTHEAVDFIRRHKDQPFLLYLPHTAVHTPLRGGDEFFGKSANGLLGDGVEEVDWSTGELLKSVRELGLERDTLIVFTSDNGGTGASSNAPFAGGKGQILEGGMRVPCIMWGPGRIPAGTHCDKIATIMDLLPTFARMAGTREPQDRRIDGRDIGALMRGEPGAESPHEAFFYYYMSQLQAVRSGKWKLHLALDAKLVTWTGRPAGTAKAQLYDLSADPAELNNVIGGHPDVVRHLTELADKARKDIGDYQVKGAGARPTIRVAKPQPLNVPESAMLPFPEPPSGREERVPAVFPGKRPQRRE
jgi:arylsulfatase A-like enzyme